MENRNKPYYIDYSKSAENLKKNSLKNKMMNLLYFRVLIGLKKIH